MLSSKQTSSLTNRLLIAAGACLALWIAVFAINFWRSTARIGHMSPSAEEYFRDKAPLGVPFFTDNDKYEVSTISGIEFKVYTTVDHKKNYIGPPGSRLILSAEGVPISASIDSKESSRIDAERQEGRKKMHQLMEEERRSGKQ